MMSGRFGAVRGDVLRLFEGESVAGLGDGELLERFADRRDEVAFEALVSRLGPMVLGICRRMLADPHDVDDAFQATFLVLVRRAGSIRERDLVAPWLHGVATKVARRARADSARRAARERVAVVETAREEGAGVESEWPELRALIDEEIGRLPENHRRAVVLCDVEGLSREEAALRLGWSLNMVRGRLERARDRLRGRLARRGLAPSGAWAALLVVPPTLSPALLAATSRAALAFSVGRMGAGLASASAVALSQGVLRMMMYSKLKTGLAVLLSTSFVAGSGMLAAQGPGGAPRAEPKAEAPTVAQNDATGQDDLATLGKRRVEKARKRWETQLAFYNEGRITIDRLLDASQILMDAERDADESRAGRLAAIRAHLDRVKEVERREMAELAAGRATAADVEEAQTRRLDTEYRLAKEAETAAREALPAPGPANPVPTPGGPIPAPGLGASRPAERPAPGRSPFDLDPGPRPGASRPEGRPALSPLAAAIEAFNAEAARDEIGRDQPPLTEDEVVAAIRYFEDDSHMTFIKGALDEFRLVAATRDMPSGMRLVHFQTNDFVDGDFIYEGWWIRIEMTKEGGANSTIPIRSRVLRSLTLEEAVKWASTKQARAIQAATPEGRKTAYQFEEVVKHLKQRIIARRDGKRPASAN